jgi:hypothetical protein
MHPHQSLILAFAVVAFPAPEVSAQDHLKPERGSLNESNGNLEYAKVLRNTLLKDAATFYQARVICRPSFKPEWVVTLLYEDGGDAPGFFVESAVFEARDGVPITEAKVKKARAGLDRETAESVQQVWLRMLRQVRYSNRPVGGGADGVTYYFSRAVPFTDDDLKMPSGRETGWIWTPEPRSLTGQMARLGIALKEYTIAPAGEQLKLQENIRAVARGLLDKLDVD